jgi:cytochrome b6-f complex iron-sulfur subunit
MDRRLFIKQSCGACGALTLGALLQSIGLQSCASGLGVLKLKSTEGKISIPKSVFNQQKTQLVRVAEHNYDIAVQAHADGTYTAMILLCTHAKHPLTKAGDKYYCTLHGSRFDSEGKVLKGPASTPMQHLPISFTTENIIITL